MSRYEVVKLHELERVTDTWIPIRRPLGIEAFGVNAWTGDEGASVIGEHTEETTGHEELYVVIAGRATFTVDGEEHDAPMGTIVHVRDPETKRGAVAAEAGTIVLAIGGKPGEAYAPLAWETNAEAMPLFASGEYEKAREVLLAALEKHPDAAGILYNLACAEARLGNTDAAFDCLRRAIDKQASFADYAREDPDFESIRDAPEFREIVADAQPTS
jgi:tetratricopeptide (TPR) repeat protein